MASRISYDMNIEILSRTSLDSFDAMRCTSKEYNKLTYDSYLINMYKQRNKIISGLIMQNITDSKNPIKEFVPSNESDSLDLGFLPENARIIASSEHGIIVLESPHPSMLLYHVCKPATKQIFQLPLKKPMYETYKAAIVVISSNPLHYKIIRFSLPEINFTVKHWRAKYCVEIFDSKTWRWRFLDYVKFPCGVMMREQLITTRGSIYTILTNNDIWKFDTYSEHWSTFLSPKPTHNLLVYFSRKLIKCEGKLGFACKRYNGFWEIWVLSIDKSWEKTYVLSKKDDTKLMSLEALYDSDTSVMLYFNRILFHRFQGDDTININDKITKARSRHLYSETFVFRSDYECMI